MRFAALVLLLATACSREPAAQQRPSSGCPALPVETFGYDRHAALDLHDSMTAVMSGVEVHAISFASPPGGRATGFLFVPQKKAVGRIPGIVVQHGMPGSSRSVYRDAVNIARHGAVAIGLDAPWNNRPGGVIQFTPQDSVEQVQLIVNLRRAFDLLSARNDVDSTRLAYAGVSYGGAMGGLLAGVEHRPVTYVLIVGDGGLVAHFTDDSGSILPNFSRMMASPEQADRWLQAMRPIEPIRYLPCARAKLLFLNGRVDQLVTEGDALAYQAAAPDPKTIKWYDLGHGLGVAAKVDELNWLHDTIGTDPAGSPETGE
ncbi:MAG: prolyl oligopeptidase family serine peptidase [Gemmatimonadota bacterium]